MSDFIHFVCWFACVFASALCVAGLAGDHWHFQSAAIKILLPLYLSIALGSFLFLGIWKLRVAWHSFATLMQSDSMARALQTSSTTARKANVRPSQCVLD